MQNPDVQVQVQIPGSPQPTATAAPVGAMPLAVVGYRAAKAQRDELADQLENLVEQRHGLLVELDDHNDVLGPANSGMQQRIVQIDQRITDLDKAIAAADLQVAKAAAIPGAVVADRPFDGGDTSPGLYFAGGTALLLFALMLPISIASARRMWRRNATAVSEFPRELMERLGRLEQTSDATAIEIERIGEGQRFVTKLLTDRADRALGETVAVQSRERG